MIRIGLLSDTHNYVHPRIIEFFKDVDEIWHAGDFGNISVANELRKIKPLKGVHGNIDGQDVRIEFPKHLRFLCEEVDVWMTHIGGYPGKYDLSIKNEIQANPPQLFISGHSHILKVIYDKKLKLLHINPGAAGKYGMHVKITAVRFRIDKKEIKDLEVLDITRD
jgi:uncharacterized protein